MPRTLPRIMTLLGTRPEIVRLSETIRKLDAYTDHCLVFTGQSYDYEMSRIFFDELDVREPDYTLDVRANSTAKQVGNILARCEKVLVKEKPDAVLVLGDTNSALSAYVARRLGIQVFHMEAGNRCWNRHVPEEINRKIIDHIADVNLCYTEHARSNLLREGLHPNDIYVIGSPLPEVYNRHKDSIQRSVILDELAVKPKGYLLASIHREENVTDHHHLSKIMQGLSSLGHEYRVPIVFSTHPRTREKLSGKESGLASCDNVLLHAPFGMFDYIRLQQNALCCLSDSGTIHEDAALLGIVAVNVRTSQERPEAYETGNVIMSGVEPDDIQSAVRTAIQQDTDGIRFDVPWEYQVTDYSNRAVRLIMSLVYGRRTG